MSAIQFLTWLADHEQTLDSLRQRHVDQWYATGNKTRELVETLLYWGRSESTAVFGEEERIAAIRRILLDNELALADRAIAGLVLLLGQPVRRIVTLRTNEVNMVDDTVRL